LLASLAERGAGMQPCIPLRKPQERLALKFSSGAPPVVRAAGRRRRRRAPRPGRPAGRGHPADPKAERGPTRRGGRNRHLLLALWPEGREPADAG
jgi:hypothetical protein